MLYWTYNKHIEYLQLWHDWCSSKLKWNVVYITSFIDLFWFFRTFCVFHINDKNVNIAESTCTNQCEVKMSDLETRKTYMLHQAVFYIGRIYKKSPMCAHYEWPYSSTKTFIDMHINCSSWDKSTTLKYNYIRNVDYKL